MSIRSDVQVVRHGNGCPPRGHVVLFTSGQPGVGSTTLALNAGLLLAQRQPPRSATASHSEVLLQIATPALPFDPRGFALRGLRLLTPDRRDGDHGNGHGEPPATTRLGHRWLLVDCSPGLSPQLRSLGAQADLLVLVVTPEPAALADGYGLLKLLARDRPWPRTGVVVNMAASRSEAESVAGRLIRTAQRFLGRSVERLGYVPLDPHVSRAARGEVPLSLRFPRCPASVCIGRICERLPAAASGVCAGGLWPRLASLLL